VSPAGPPELEVDDAAVAELVLEAGHGHGAERRAAEVEVVLGHRVVVHVGDDHRLRVAGTGSVFGASYLGKKKGNKTEWVETQNCARAFRFHYGLTAAAVG